MVDQAVNKLLTDATPPVLQRAVPLIDIGLHHEQQHQELILTDILHAFSQNPPNRFTIRNGGGRRARALVPVA